jgi:ParB family chromosome partitioning protein
MSAWNVLSIPLDEIELGPNVRERLDEAHAAAIAESARSAGILTPIELEPLGPKRHRLLDGAHRLAAARSLGLKSIPAIVRPAEGDAARIERQLLLNCTRADLRPLERARAIARLIETTGWTAGETAGRLGLSPAVVSKSLTLLELPPEMQTAIDEGRVGLESAYHLARLEDPVERAQALQSLLDDRAFRRRRAPATTPATATPAAAAPSASMRATARLGPGRSLTLTGPGLTLERLIECLETLLGRARKARRQGVMLSRFLALLSAEAQATAP